MRFIMTTKRVLNCLISLIICCYSAFAQVGESCTVKTGGKGTCQIPANCPKAQEQAQNGISPTVCGYYQLTVPIVCCEGYPKRTNGGKKPASNAIINTFLSEDENADSFVFPESESEYVKISEQKCQKYAKNTTSTIQAIPLVTDTEAVTISVVKCDYNGVALIVGGKPATAGEFPFMAAIGFDVDGTVDWRCGGTLVSERYVVTAAHCTFTREGVSPTIARLGDLDLRSSDDGSIEADYNIQNITVHPKYKYPLKYYDIALIKLASDVAFTKFIRPACLYTKSQIEVPQALATGWGKTDYAASDISDKLMKVSLNIYNNNRCSQTYKSNKNLPQGILSNMICAGKLEGGMDTCQGDSGGPLLITNKGNQCKFYLIGITSFGKSCGQANTPAVYTRVSDFVPWIAKTIW